MKKYFLLVALIMTSALLAQEFEQKNIILDNINSLFNYLFKQYSEYSTINISLEIIAVIFGLASVVYSKKNNILVFPTGMISTLIFTYLLYKWGLFGDMFINFYYFIMSIYGWYIWSNKNNHIQIEITRTTLKEKKQACIIFTLTILFVVLIYLAFDKFNNWTAYVDTLTTGICFVSMWLMAKRKIENWILWIIADIISVPLYFYKGYTFSSFQYLIFIFIAIFGYIEWKKILEKKREFNYIRKK